MHSRTIFALVAVVFSQLTFAANGVSSETASGDNQTTVVDSGGNLKMVPPGSAQPSGNPSSPNEQTMPPEQRSPDSPLAQPMGPQQLPSDAGTQPPSDAGDGMGQPGSPPVMPQPNNPEMPAPTQDGR